MPQIVEALSQKHVTQVAVGLDFVIALGQDFDEHGFHIQKSLSKSEVPKPPSDSYTKKEAPFDYSGYQRVEKDFVSP